jgi:hypothetical protein
MNYHFLKTYGRNELNDYGRNELGIIKCKIIDKYKIKLNSNLYWENEEPKYPKQEYFSHKFAVKSSPLGMVFHIFRLCFAKTKYFENNWNKFVPIVYDWQAGFIESDLYNMEFIKHKKSGIIIDLRTLAKINRIKDFQRFCDYLEKRGDLGANYTEPFNLDECTEACRISLLKDTLLINEEMNTVSIRLYLVINDVQIDAVLDVNVFFSLIRKQGKFRLFNCTCGIFECGSIEVEAVQDDDGIILLSDDFLHTRHLLPHKQYIIAWEDVLIISKQIVRYIKKTAKNYPEKNIFAGSFITNTAPYELEIQYIEEKAAKFK